LAPSHTPRRSHSSCLYQPTCPLLKLNVRKKSYVIPTCPLLKLNVRKKSYVIPVTGPARHLRLSFALPRRPKARHRGCPHRGLVSSSRSWPPAIVPRDRSAEKDLSDGRTREHLDIHNGRALPFALFLGAFKIFTNTQ